MFVIEDGFIFQSIWFISQFELGVFSALALLTHFFNAQNRDVEDAVPYSRKQQIRRIIMENYKEMYYILFNAITEATRILVEAQKKTEEVFINQE